MKTYTKHLRDRLGQLRASDAPNVTSTTLAVSLETPRHRANLKADTAAAFEREYFTRGLDKPAKRRAMSLPPDQAIMPRA